MQSTTDNESYTFQPENEINTENEGNPDNDNTPGSGAGTSMQGTHRRPPKRTLNEANAALTTEVMTTVRDHFKRPVIRDDRYDILGKSVALRLRELPSQQKIIAEKIIHDTIYEAEMGSLTIHHKVINTQNNYNHFNPSAHFLNDSTYRSLSTIPLRQTRSRYSTQSPTPTASVNNIANTTSAPRITPPHVSPQSIQSTETFHNISPTLTGERFHQFSESSTESTFKDLHSYRHHYTPTTQDSDSKATITILQSPNPSKLQYKSSIPSPLVTQYSHLQGTPEQIYSSSATALFSIPENTSTSNTAANFVSNFEI